MAESSVKSNEKLFKDVKFYLIGNINSKVEQLLIQGGAKRDHYLGEIVTHVIAEDTNELDYSEAREVFDLPVVTSQWVLKSVQCGTLLPTEAFSPASNQLFSGVVACASNLSKEDAKTIWALITFYGGKTQSRLDKNVTHLICSDETGVKYASATTNHSENLKVINPDWVTVCVQQKCRISEAEYHPKLQITDAFIRPAIDVADVVSTVELSQPQEDLKVILTPLSHVAKATVRASALVPSAILPSLPQEDEASFDVTAPPVPTNSEVSESFLDPQQISDTCNIQSTEVVPTPAKKKQRSRSTSASPRNSKNREEKLGKGIKTSRNKSVAKINQLFPSDAMLTPQQHPFSWQQGLFFDSSPPTYVGHDPSDQVPPEVCLLSCVFYITDYQKYVDIAQLDVWKKVIVQRGGQVDESYSNRVTHVLCENQNSDVFHLALRDGKRLVTAHWLNDCLLQQSLTPPWITLHLPSKYSGLERPYGSQVISLTNFEGEERTRVKFMIAGIGAKYTGFLSKLNSVLIAKSATGLKYTKALEWQMPIVNVTWLNDLLLGDTAALKLPLNSRYTHFDNCTDLFKIDTQRFSYLMNGWRTPVKVSKEFWKKYAAGYYGSPASISFPSLDHSQGQKRPIENGTSEHDSTAKKPRQEEPSSSAMEVANDLTPVVLITGISHTESANLAKLVSRLGGQMATSPLTCSHLVAPSVIRTVKFLVAFSSAKHVVKPEWIEKSIQHGQFLDETDFLLSDATAEKEYNFNLQESHKRAREKPLFEEMMFYITPSVMIPDKVTLKSLIESAGGKLVPKRPCARTIANSVNVEGNPTFIVITCSEDLPLVPDLRDKNIGLQSAEFVVTGIIRQQLDYESFLVTE